MRTGWWIAAILTFIVVQDVWSQEITCDGTTFTIVNDANLDAAIASARQKFLQSRPTPVTVLDATVLVPHRDGTQVTWKRGSYKPYELGYPAR